MKDIINYTITVLQDLIKTNKDEYRLFEAASRKSGDAELKSLFEAYAGKKEEYISKLEKEVIRLGGCPETNKNDPENSDEFYDSPLYEENWNRLIADCLKKDDLAIKKYFYAIRKNIMWEVLPLVAKQYFDSKSFHDQIQNICIERSGGLIHQMGIH